MAALVNFTMMAKAVGDSKTKTGIAALKSMIETVGQKISTFVSGETGMSTAIDALGNFFTAINPLTPILQVLSDVFGVFADIIGAQMAPVMQKLFEILLSPSVIALISKLGEVFAALFTAILPLLDIFLKLVIPIIMPILDILVVVIGYFAAGIKILMTFLSPLVDFLVGVFLFAIQNVGKAFWWIVDYVLKPVINAIIAIANGFIWAINQVLKVVTLGTVQIPSIPYLDTGGDILQSGLAVVHKNERVLNAEEATAYRGEGTSMSNAPVTNNFYLTNNGIIGEEDFLNSLADKVSEKLARSGTTNRG